MGELSAYIHYYKCLIKNKYITLLFFTLFPFISTISYNAWEKHKIVDIITSHLYYDNSEVLNIYDEYNIKIDLIDKSCGEFINFIHEYENSNSVILDRFNDSNALYSIDILSCSSKFEYIIKNIKGNPRSYNDISEMKLPNVIIYINHMFLIYKNKNYIEPPKIIIPYVYKGTPLSERIPYIIFASFITHLLIPLLDNKFITYNKIINKTYIYYIMKYILLITLSLPIILCHLILDRQLFSMVMFEYALINISYGVVFSNIYISVLLKIIGLILSIYVDNSYIILNIFPEMYVKETINTEGYILYLHIIPILSILLPFIKKPNFKKIPKGYILYNISYKSVFNKFSLNNFNNKKIIISGRNGCGKSTILKIIMGIISPSKGAVSHPKNISYCPQYSMLCNFMTVYDHIIFYNNLYNSNRGYDLILIFDLKDKINTKICKLSGGDKKKVSIIISLIKYEPYVQYENSYVLLDEPTAQLSPEYRDKLIDIINLYDLTFIIVSHYITELSVLRNKININLNVYSNNRHIDNIYNSVHITPSKSNIFRLIIGIMCLIILNKKIVMITTSIIMFIFYIIANIASCYIYNYSPIVFSQVNKTFADLDMPYSPIDIIHTIYYNNFKKYNITLLTAFIPIPHYDIKEEIENKYTYFLFVLINLVCMKYCYIQKYFENHQINSMIDIINNKLCRRIVVFLIIVFELIILSYCNILMYSYINLNVIRPTLIYIFSLLLIIYYITIIKKSKWIIIYYLSNIIISYITSYVISSITLVDTETYCFLMSILSDHFSWFIYYDERYSSILYLYSTLAKNIILYSIINIYSIYNIRYYFKFHKFFHINRHILQHLRVENLNIVYNNTTYLENIHINLPYRGKVCLMAKNGTGKSSILNTIAKNSMNPHSRIMININHDVIPIYSCYYDKYIVHCKQDNITLDYNALVFLNMIAYIKNINSSFIRRISNKLDVDLNKNINILSGGNLRKFNLILYLLLCSPNSILLLDEPTLNLDKKSIRIIYEILMSMQLSILSTSNELDVSDFKIINLFEN